MSDRAHIGQESAGERARWRWTTIGGASLLCCALIAVRNGAEQVDSGWAVAMPSALETNQTQNLEQQLVIRHVLEQTRPQPLLHKPAAAQAGKSTTELKPAVDPAPEPEAQGQDVEHHQPRVATRPEAADGWRPTGAPANDPLMEDWTVSAPPRDANVSNTTQKNSSSKATSEIEFDCGGTPRVVERPAALRLQQPAAPTTLPAQKLADKANASDDEADCSGAQPEAGDTATSETSNDAQRESAETQRPVTTIERNAQPPASATKPIRSAPGATAPIADVPVVNTLPPLSEQLLSLRTRVRTVLKGYYRKALNSHDNDPWEAMHGMLAYGVHSRIHDGGATGQLITSVGWLCYNKPCKGQTLLYVTPAGELRAKYGVGLQGHLGQFLAMLAQCHVSPDYPIHVGNHQFTIHDLIEAEKKTCYPKSELTFKLIALQNYADLNDQWVNDQGVEWDFPRLVREELEQPIRGAACGGTHRLSGLSLVVKTRLRRGEPLDGEYQRAAEFVKKYQQYAFRLQNRDGSLSTSWFRGAGDEEDIDRRIKTTGHILEWLCYSLSDDQLREPETVRAVTYLANLMFTNYDKEWETGPRCHATHALLLYDERVFQPFDRDGEIAVYRPMPSLAKKKQSQKTPPR